MNIEHIKKNVLMDFLPTDNDKKEMKKLTEELLATLLPLKDKVDEIKRIELLGSIKKGTWIRKETDIDIFIFLEKNANIKEVNKKIENYLTKHGLSPWKEYAQHEYFKLIFKGYPVDIVPAYDTIKGEKIISAVDRTPHHVDFFLKNSNQKIIEDVVLLKRFLKTLGLYGAELKIEGFSGFACELLVIYYGSFEAILKSSHKWHDETIIYFDRPPKQECLKEIRRHSKSNLIIIDPTDPCRNVAAPISQETLNKFILASNLFFDAPSPRFFRKIDIEILNEILHPPKRRLIVLSHPAPKTDKETLAGQVKRFKRLLCDSLKQNHFVIGACKEIWDEQQCYYFIESCKLLPNKCIKHFGPPPNLPNVVDFLEKHLKSENRLFSFEIDKTINVTKHIPPVSLLSYIKKFIKNTKLPSRISPFKDMIELHSLSVSSKISALDNLKKFSFFENISARLIEEMLLFVLGIDKVIAVWYLSKMESRS